ncbi:MAG: FAD-dependent oxidoreductase [Candidatus Aureabacteria bacterium]|nr:FAD-dependent oxidoreductase [Candidatus Auribacterota bacterium]
MDRLFDMVVIGGGSGGLFAASVANTLGAKTCLIDKKRLGGDCTWYGCMPSKSLIKSAAVAEHFKKREAFGLKLSGNANIDASGVMSHVQEIINDIGEHEKPSVFEERGITVIIGPPKFLNENTLEVNNEKITFKKCIISTGSHPLILPIEGLQDIDYLTNETVFSLEKLPDSLIVLGGGPIGVELSQALNRLGVKVSIVEMMDRILFREDNEVSPFVEKKLVDEGVKLYTGQKAVKFAKENGHVVVTLEDKDKKSSSLSASRVLAAIGRAPNVEGLDLEKAGVKYSRKGIEANAHLQTTNKKIFVCGDVVGPYQFSHVAAYQAYVAVRNALFRKIAWSKVSYINVPWATFTDPELARVGFTEIEAREKYSKIKVYKTPYSNVDRSKTDVATEGLIKVITDKKGYVVGAHVVGSDAGEIIQGFLIAKSLKIKLEKLASILFIYPTLSELVKKTAAQALVEKAGNPLVKLLIKLLKKT